MKLWIILWLLFCGTALNCMAQNRIDEIVADFSSLGISTFTSAVERNPKTHKVSKVVKVLKLTAFNNNWEIRNAFNAEKDRGNTTVQTDDMTTTITITQENKNEVRIYSLNYETRTKRNNVVTIIIKYKNNN